MVVFDCLEQFYSKHLFPEKGKIVEIKINTYSSNQINVSDRVSLTQIIDDSH